MTVKLKNEISFIRYLKTYTQLHRENHPEFPKHTLELLEEQLLVKGYRPSRVKTRCVLEGNLLNSYSPLSTFPPLRPFSEAALVEGNPKKALSLLSEEYLLRWREARRISEAYAGGTRPTTSVGFLV